MKATHPKNVIPVEWKEGGTVMKPLILSTLALSLLISLAACSQAGQPNSQAGAADNTAQSANGASEKGPSGISGEIHKAMQKAKQELATKNISVSSVHINDSSRTDDDSRPKAEITPQGDLLIAGKKVPATPAQQTLLLDYRQQIIGIAETGMDIGAQGADLGLNAAKEGVWGALTGKSDKDIEASIKPQTDKIQSAALKLCQRMPDLLSSQQKLAAAMPEFRPYATMQQKDVDDCGKDMKDKDGKKGFAVFSD
jgi:predicted small lipoprotein YifL